MRIKIISNGDRNNTQVVNAETGEPIEFVRSVTWRIGVDEIATAEIEVILTEVEVEGNVGSIVIHKAGSRRA